MSQAPIEISPRADEETLDRWTALMAEVVMDLVLDLEVGSLERLATVGGLSLESERRTAQLAKEVLAFRLALGEVGP